MHIKMILVGLLIISGFLLGGCANVPPAKPNNICDIFDDKSDWYKYARKSVKRWGSTIPVMMAIMYNAQSQKRSKIRLNDPYNLYLAYHEGHGGFNRGTYKKKTWLRNTAQQVSNRAAMYSRQLPQCEDRLKGPWWWPF